MPLFQSSPASQIKKLADSLRPQLDPHTGLLPSPSTNYLALNASRPQDIKDIVDWGIFNPYGPTLFTLTLVGSPLTSEYFIFQNTENPFTSTRKIYGLIRSDLVSNPQRLALILNALFRQAGSEIAGNTPSSVHFLPGSPLTPTQVKEMFFQALLADPPTNLERDCEHLAAFKGRPWDRASAELADAREALLTGKQPPTVPLTRAVMEKWWSLITDPYHLKTEAAQMPIAWEGALKHARPF